MRVSSPLATQSLIELSESSEKKGHTTDISKKGKPVEESQSYFPPLLGSSGTYSVSSLRAAVDYHAKFLTVAESNLQASQHSAAIPQAVLDRLHGNG